MYRVLVAQCEQEISSFNPVPSDESAFDIHVGDDLIEAHQGGDTCVRGALDVFRARSDVERRAVVRGQGL